MGENKKTTLTNNSTHKIKLINKVNESVALVSNIYHSTTMFLSVYVEVIAIKIVGVIDVSTNILLSLISKFEIESKLKMLSSIALSISSKIGINSLKEISTSVNLTKLVKLKIDGLIEINNGDITILNNLDTLSLDEMDSQTLGELGFNHGILLSMQKKIETNSINQVSTLVDLLMYQYNSLIEYDNELLGSMDDMTLEDLDRSLV